MSGGRIDPRDLPVILAELREHIRRIVAARNGRP